MAPGSVRGIPVVCVSPWKSINSLLSPYTPDMPADEQWSSPAHLTDAKECGHVGLKQVWLSARGEARRGALVATWSRSRSIADQRQRAGESVLRATPERQGSDVSYLFTQFHLRSHIAIGATGALSDQ